MNINNCLYCKKPLSGITLFDGWGMARRKYQCPHKHQLKCSVNYIDTASLFDEDPFKIDIIEIGFEKDNLSAHIQNYLKDGRCIIGIGDPQKTNIFPYSVEDNYCLNHSLHDIYRLIIRLKNLQVFS